jgi:hypothetical protein
LQVGYGCYGEVTIDINSVEGTLQLSGTQTLGSTLSAVDDNEIPSNGGPNNDDNQYSFIPVASSVDLNVVAGNNGIFNDFTIHGEENGSTCTFWSVTTPAS